jgi:hypothetical protein
LIVGSKIGMEEVVGIVFVVVEVEIMAKFF